jgi:hypothetical protein
MLSDLLSGLTAAMSVALIESRRFFFIPPRNFRIWIKTAEPKMQKLTTVMKCNDTPGPVGPLSLSVQNTRKKNKTVVGGEKQEARLVYGNLCGTSLVLPVFLGLPQVGYVDVDRVDRSHWPWSDRRPSANRSAAFAPRERNVPLDR